MCALKILALVEATTVNAVARNVIDFHRSANELSEAEPGFAPIEVSIATFIRQSADGQSENDFIVAARAAGLHVDVISERGRFDRRIVPALGATVAKQRPDIIVTHSVKSHFVLFRSQLWRDIPWIAYHHGYTSTDLKMRFYNLFDRRSLPKADRVVTVCRAFAQELETNKRVKNISVLHNSIRPQPAVDEADVRALREKLGTGPNNKIILSVGRLSKEKAHADLVRAFARLLENNSDLNAKVVIVGDGPERANLVAQTSSSNLTERIIFAGHVSDVQPYYALADVLANSSHSEGSPYVLLEAMAAGVPIVATAVGGVPEMLENGKTALLVSSGNADEMASAIAELLSKRDESARLSANARTLSHNRFSPENYVKTFSEICRDVVGNRAGS
jgi:glycosyltransferase involved in cell wall biosynthesis